MPPLGEPGLHQTLARYSSQLPLLAQESWGLMPASLRGMHAALCPVCQAARWQAGEQ